MGGRGATKMGMASTSWTGVQRKRCEFGLCRRRGRHMLTMENGEGIFVCRKHTREVIEEAGG